MSETILKDKDLQDRWVAALRSGEYKQGKGALKDKEGGFCCLGLLCEIQSEGMGGTWGALSENDEYLAFYAKGIYTKGKTVLVPNGPPYDVAHALAILNDRGCSFETLASMIEGGADTVMRLVRDE